jgi:N-acetylglutamate synthase-like GNAT family acetyltransferase
VPQSITTELSSPSSPKAQPLLDALSGELQRRFGSDGRARFAEWREHDQRYVFVLARQDGQPAGCGAVRPIHPGIGEIKRMYAAVPRHGVGSAVLRRLVEEARKAGYGSLWLQTRWAVEFYRSHGFTERENYGHYVGRSQCACFERRLF